MRERRRNKSDVADKLEMSARTCRTTVNDFNLHLFKLHPRLKQLACVDAIWPPTRQREIIRRRTAEVNDILQRTQTTAESESKLLKLSETFRAVQNIVWIFKWWREKRAHWLISTMVVLISTCSCICNRCEHICRLEWNPISSSAGSETEEASKVNPTSQPA